MIALSGAAYERKCEKVADAYAHLTEANGMLSNLLGHIHSALLDEDEEHVAKMCKHYDAAVAALKKF